jgi:AraC-like DNA-binding protein
MRSPSRQLVQLLERLAPLEGYNLTALAAVRLLRSNRPLMRTPVLYEPGIVIVGQGRKRGFLGDDVYVYDAQHYLAVSVPVPFTMETDASEAQPLLAIYLQLDLNMVADLLHDTNGSVPHANPKGMYATPLDATLRDAVIRLLRALDSPLDAKVLGSALVREIHYRVLTSEQGASMRAALASRGQFAKISRALRQIHKRYSSRLSIDELAAMARMSAPSFYAHFKAITRSSPMQYVKSVRLHQARLLMAQAGRTAAAAAAEVGYESPSQFAREFKRLFGRTPTLEAERLRNAYALPARVGRPRYVSSH